MATILQKLRGQVTMAFERRSKIIHNAMRMYRAVFFAFSAGVAGVMQFWSWKPGEQPSAQQIIGIGATSIVLIASIISIIAERDSSRELSIAQSALAHATDLEENLREVAARWPDVDQMIALHQATKVMRDVLEQSTVAMAGDEIALADVMLSVAAMQLRIAAGFSLGDNWTICIYHAEPAPDDCRFQLKLIAHDRTVPCDTKSARIWPEGIGVAGVAFSHRHELLVADLASKAVQTVFQPAGYVRGYDNDRYRSMIAVPVLVAGNEWPWGVVTATVDRAAHFNHNAKFGFKPEEAIRALANYVALAVAYVHASRRAHDPPPTP